MTFTVTDLMISAISGLDVRGPADTAAFEISTCEAATEARCRGPLFAPEQETNCGADTEGQCEAPDEMPPVSTCEAATEEGGCDGAAAGLLPADRAALISQLEAALAARR